MHSAGVRVLMRFNSRREDIRRRDSRHPGNHRPSEGRQGSLCNIQTVGNMPPCVWDVLACSCESSMLTARSAGVSHLGLAIAHLRLTVSHRLAHGLAHGRAVVHGRGAWAHAHHAARGVALDHLQKPVRFSTRRTRKSGFL